MPRTFANEAVATLSKAKKQTHVQLNQSVMLIFSIRCITSTNQQRHGDEDMTCTERQNAKPSFTKNKLR